MDPTTTATDPISRPKPNGILTQKQHPHHYPIIRHHPPPPPPPLYRECLKNHAASLGSHVLDGCGEFMPSPSSNPSDPSSLTCAACGCHRNFHRRSLLYGHGRSAEDGGGGGATSQNDDTDDCGGGEADRRHRSTSPPPPSAPHMLLALSTGEGLSPAAAAGPKKRLRSKFSPEQKDRMQGLSERLGWRMQKRDDALIEDTCRDIGVGKAVFKVWMHNNKHNFAFNNNNNNNNNGSADSSP